jgi:UDP-N-acetylmuramyl pentapeptide phosphotransferase/UDP-N-acetylglucosamine-1-phosphate transferase
MMAFYDALKAFCTPSILTTGLVTFCVSLVMTRFMIWVNIHDTPSHRSSHSTITPRGGGLGIIAGFFLCMGGFLSEGFLAHIPQWKLTILGGTALGLILVSLRDDIKSLPLRHKLLTQILMASLIVINGLSFDEIPLPHFGMIHLGAFAGIISLLWVIFLTNAFNFMDGLDGLAAGSSLVASFFGVLIGIYFQEHAFLYICFALFFSTFGFFFYNFSPARIFMGDVGSQFLGLLWSVLLFLSAQTQHVELSVYTIPLLFFAFIYDVGLTILRRLYNRQSIWKPHRTFLFHILNRSGLSHRRISVIYMAFACLQGCGALYVQFLPLHQQFFMLIPYGVLMIAYTLWVQRQAKRVIEGTYCGKKISLKSMIFEKKPL